MTGRASGRDRTRFDLSRSEFRAWVRRSRAAQGLTMNVNPETSEVVRAIVRNALPPYDVRAAKEPEAGGTPRARVDDPTRATDRGRRGRA